MMSALITVCSLILGDAAVGGGVTRHFFFFFLTVLEKLKYDFSLNLGMPFISCTAKCTFCIIILMGFN